MNVYLCPSAVIKDENFCAANIETVILGFEKQNRAMWRKHAHIKKMTQQSSQRFDVANKINKAIHVINY